MKCIYCKKEIKWFHKILRIFWAPIFCETSFVYKNCCSSKCWEKELYLLIQKYDKE